MAQNLMTKAVIVDGGRWIGLSGPLPDGLLVDGAPPERLFAEVRETAAPSRTQPAGQGLSRVRNVLCERIEHLGSDVFYAPVAGQHTDDEPWEDATRVILRLRPVPTFWPVRPSVPGTS
jgi:hypothetical protein